MEKIPNQVPEDSPQQDGCIPVATKTIPSRCNEPAGPAGKDKKPAKETKTYDFTECIAFLNTRGKALFGDHFVISPADYEVIYKLLIYIIRDEENAVKYKLNLNKGILLSGPVGCGKTTLMTLLNHFQSKEARYAIRSCRDVSFEFIKEGYGIIQKYSSNAFKRVRNDSVPLTYYFDDLGTESNLKYYGNECNVMGEILLSRYDLFVTQKMLTHLTTNLNAQEIEMYYGSRVRSRMREMFNLVSFNWDVQDKRK